MEHVTNCFHAENTISFYHLLDDVVYKKLGYENPFTPHYQELLELMKNGCKYADSSSIHSATMELYYAMKNEIKNLSLNARKQLSTLYFIETQCYKSDHFREFMNDPKNAQFKRRADIIDNNMEMLNYLDENSVNILAIRANKLCDDIIRSIEEKSFSKYLLHADDRMSPSKKFVVSDLVLDNIKHVNGVLVGIESAKKQLLSDFKRKEQLIVLECELMGIFWDKFDTNDISKEKSFISLVNKFNEFLKKQKINIKGGGESSLSDDQKESILIFLRKYETLLSEIQNKKQNKKQKQLYETLSSLLCTSKQMFFNVYANKISKVDDFIGTLNKSLIGSAGKILLDLSSDEFKIKHNSLLQLLKSRQDSPKKILYNDMLITMRYGENPNSSTPWELFNSTVQLDETNIQMLENKIKELIIGGNDPLIFDEETNIRRNDKTYKIKLFIAVIVFAIFVIIIFMIYVYAEMKRFENKLR